VAELPGRGARLQRQVQAQAERKQAAQKRVLRIVWSGLGMMGTIGWSVAIPTLLGALLGHWLDTNYPSPRSWTLALLLAGLTLGCLLAWHWVAEEQKQLHREANDGRDDG